MSRRTSVRQLAKSLLAELTALLQERDELAAENARLRARLAEAASAADAYDRLGVSLDAADEEQ